jgi:hypothetical protein
MEDAMIDWFVMLVPFAVLPVVLIFGFVGCALDTEGIPAAPGLTYPPSLPVPIGSVLTIAVSMTVTGEDGDSKSAQASRSVMEIKPTGETIEFPSIELDAIDAEEEGSATCTVTLTISGNPDTTFSLPTATHTNPTADFTLSVTGLGNKLADFTLT